MFDFYRWPSIKDIKKVVLKLRRYNIEKACFDYRIKLHGTNVAVQVYPDGKLVCQSRNRIITPYDDQNGFAKWVESNQHLFIPKDVPYILYGEWIGKGIQKANTAASALETPVMCLFAYRSLVQNSPFLVSPAALQSYARPSGLIYALPIMGTCVLDIANLEPTLQQINTLVGEIENLDPWVDSVFGVKGEGEGLVFYPTSERLLPYFSNYMFKVKSPKYMVTRKRSPASIDPQVVADAQAFVDIVLTSSRLQQALHETNTARGNLTDLSCFIKWVIQDVKKENEQELIEGNLVWAQVNKQLALKTKEWFLTK